jgi:hypothetical protein
LKDALRAGKTIFFLLSDYKTDDAAIGFRIEKGSRMYSTSTINNYSVLPIKVNARNAKGRQLSIVDRRFKGLHDILREIAGYKVIVDENVGKKIFTTKDNNGVVSSIVTIDNFPGKLVLLPHFDLSDMHEYDKKSDVRKWTKEALRLSNSIVGQLIVLDKALRELSDRTPAPDWLNSTAKPKQVSTIEQNINDIEKQILELEKSKEHEITAKEKLLQFSSLLYETGKSLENAIEDSLRLLGYKVENYRKGDIEIDHVIVGPSGIRMIGESEGKDSSAIDISKFRQLESNIGEDFEREEISSPAKGVLFGNGYRFTNPNERPEQFTEKCFTNAKRLHTALVRTSDLYPVILYILDNPQDETFKNDCRKALEETDGEIVIFPQLPKVLKKRTKIVD